MHFCTCYSGYSTFVWLQDTVVTALFSQSLCEVLPEDQNAFSGLLQMHFCACYSGYSTFVWLLDTIVTAHSSRSLCEVLPEDQNTFSGLLQMQFCTCYSGYSTFVWLMDTVVTAHSSQSLCEVLPEEQNTFSGLLLMHYCTCYSGYSTFVYIDICYGYCYRLSKPSSDISALKTHQSQCAIELPCPSALAQNHKTWSLWILIQEGQILCQLQPHDRMVSSRRLLDCSASFFLLVWHVCVRLRACAIVHDVMPTLRGVWSPPS